MEPKEETMGTCNLLLVGRKHGDTLDLSLAAEVGVGPALWAPSLNLRGSD